MKISHVIASLDVSTGGPARSSTSLVKALLEFNNIEFAEILTLVSDEPIMDNFNNSKGSIKFFETTILDYSKKLDIYLKSQSDIDLYHAHGIWNIPMHQVAKYARSKRKPYIISIRGMLEPWSMQQSRLKKKIAMALFQNRDLTRSDCIHATAFSEAESIRYLGYKNPIAVIPNGIDLDDYPLKDLKSKSAKKKILFLSRIHYKKGIELLIEAWGRLDPVIRADWEIEIAGNGDSIYIDKLKRSIVEKGFQNDIKIVGPKFGKDKINTYHNADVFVLPTYSENFGIVIAEALACGIPVITTKGTPWKDINEYFAGEWIEIGVDALVISLKEMMRKSDLELNEMGRNGRKLIEDKYSIDSVSARFYELYSWILSNDNKPDFVI
ncbi:glycosyltransferase [uncultured Sphingobacterium sp.]|uniref:glycosyltransferase n=1 Tax=uncultured Sphingobacterium sp. TaxID=182688 RepID=UPI0025F97600|nr:glycosyltransferase [uncultured Sphingobacterium sp.]